MKYTLIARKETIDQAIDALRASNHSTDHVRYLNYQYPEWQKDQLRAIAVLKKLKARAS